MYNAWWTVWGDMTQDMRKRAAKVRDEYRSFAPPSGKVLASPSMMPGSLDEVVHLLNAPIHEQVAALEADSKIVPAPVMPVVRAVEQAEDEKEASQDDDDDATYRPSRKRHRRSTTGTGSDQLLAPAQHNAHTVQHNAPAAGTLAVPAAEHQMLSPAAAPSTAPGLPQYQVKVESPALSRGMAQLQAKLSSGAMTTEALVCMLQDGPQPGLSATAAQPSWPLPSAQTASDADGGGEPQVDSALLAADALADPVWMLPGQPAVAGNQHMPCPGERRQPPPPLRGNLKGGAGDGRGPSSCADSSSDHTRYNGLGSAARLPALQPWSDASRAQQGWPLSSTGRPVKQDTGHPAWVPGWDGRAEAGVPAAGAGHVLGQYPSG